MNNYLMQRNTSIEKKASKVDFTNNICARKIMHSYN